MQLNKIIQHDVSTGLPLPDKSVDVVIMNPGQKVTVKQSGATMFYTGRKCGMIYAFTTDPNNQLGDHYFMLEEVELMKEVAI